MTYRFEEIYQREENLARYLALAEEQRKLGHTMDELRFFSAPGRSELGGNHTDHQNGKVLAAAVDVDTIAAVAENGSDRICLHSMGFPACSMSVDPSQNTAAPGSSDALLAGMIAAFAPNCTLRGLDIFASSTVLPGGGLSSSASVEVLLAEIFNACFCGDAMSPLKLAQIGQWVENVYFGKPCGLLDQAASAVGGVTCMDFSDPSAPAVEKLDLDLAQYGYALFIINCGADHADLTDEYAAIPGELKELCAAFGANTLSEVDETAFYDRLAELRERCSDRAVLRAIHVFDENRRVESMRAALQSNDFAAFLSLVRASGLSSWRYLQNVAPTGSLRQPMAVTLAVCERLLNGKGACRVHGGGFAGTIQAYVPLTAAESFRAEMERILPTCSCAVRSVRHVGAAEVLLPATGGETVFQ